MMTVETIHEAYRDRLEVDACYTYVSEATQNLLDQDLRRYGLRSFERVAHGVLTFCIDEGSPTCVPWLVSPDAPPHDIIGGRHGLVTREFYDVADEAGLSSYTKGASRSVDYDDFIGTYVIQDDANETPFTVLCDSGTSSQATQEHVELIKDLSRILTDHRIVIGAGGEESPRTFMTIRDGDATEVPYGYQRGLKLPTIAETHDIMGKSRELENYANFAQKHGLNQWEFSWLAEKAVEAFHARRQVGLDELCQEVLAERETQPD